MVTPQFRVSFPAVFKAKLNKLNNKQEYSVQALFKKGEDLTKLKETVKLAIEEKWGKDKNKWPKNIRTPFKDQSDRAKENEETGEMELPDGYEAGAIYLNLKSTSRPAVVDQNVEPILDETQFYGGCWAKASINAKAYSQAGNHGVSFYLNNIQKVGDGTPFGSRSRPEDDFAPVEVSEAAKSSGKTTGSAADMFD